MADQYILAVGRGLDCTMGIGVIAAYLTFVPCAYTLSERLGLHTTGNPATCAAACRRPEYRFQQFGIAAECGMMTWNACSEKPG